MNSAPPRRTSFGMLLKRSKSGDLGKGSRKARQAELERQRNASRYPPKLPEFANNTEKLSNSFSSELNESQYSSQTTDYESFERTSMEPVQMITSRTPAFPITNGGGAFDPHARTESMTNRGRYSYASTALSINGPRRVRRRKDPTPFNILVLGARNSGKTSFLEFLKNALVSGKKQRKVADEENFKIPAPASGNFIPHYVEIEIDGERIGLTLWDSEGFEKNVVDLQLREMSAFLESKFEETFAEEMKVVRSPGVQDTHIHAAFLLLDPSQLDRNIAVAKRSTVNGYQNGHNGYHQRVFGALDEALDVQVLRTLQYKTTVIPVISKADTITAKHMNVLKKSVWDSIKSLGLDPLESLALEEDDGSDRIDEDDEDGTSGGDLPTQGHRVSSPPPGHVKRLSSTSVRKYKSQEDSKEEETPFFPLSIISPDLYEPEVIGRKFVWGFADPYNEEHCDFERLKDAVFSEWRAELREASREQWYEGWRTNRLKARDPYQRQ